MKYSQLINPEIVAHIEENLLVRTKTEKDLNYWRVTPDGRCVWLNALKLRALKWEYALENFESNLCDEETEKKREDAQIGKFFNAF